MSRKKEDGRTTVYNKIVSPELMEQVNPENIELQKDFVNYLKSVDKSEGTILQYTNNLKIMWVWMLQYAKNKHFTKLTKRDVVHLQAHMLEEWKWSPKRIKMFKASLSSLGHYIEDILDDEYPEYKSIINVIKAPPDTHVRKKTVFKERELQKLLNHLVETEQYDKACVLSLAMNSGRRVSELARFKIGWFQPKYTICEGALYKSPEPMKTKGPGSRGKMMQVYVLAKPFQPYLDLWLQKRKEMGAKSDYLLFKMKDGHWTFGPVDRNDLRKWAKEFTEFLGKPFYWHSIRHFFTTKLAEMNLPDSIIQEIIGWESSEMVQLYTDTETEKKLEKYFGKDGVKYVTSRSLKEL